MSKEGSITPRTLRLTSPLFLPDGYLDKQRQKLKKEGEGFERKKEDLRNELTQKELLINSQKNKIDKFFKPKPGQTTIIFEKIIESKKTEIQKKITDPNTERELGLLNIELDLLNNDKVFNLDPWLIKFYQPSMIPDEPLMELGKNLIPNPSIPLIPYFSINAENLALINQPLNKTKLHSLEQYVFEQAIEYLEDKCAADEYFKIREGEKLLSPDNVALVNFFPRPEKIDNKIKKDKESQEIHTHTIVLWKTSENKIKIIDPSNSGFSSFLKDISVNNKFKFLVDEGKKSILKIYQADDEPPMTKRDCTDIAVKIGFELNQKQANYEVTIVQDCLEQSIEQISNTNPSAEKLKLFKALQSSDLDVRRKAAELKETIKKLKVQDKNFLTELDLTKFDSCVEPKTIVEDIQELIELLGALKDGDIL
jgi:hypothetical protein